jgi:hypothetical protein
MANIDELIEKARANGLPSREEPEGLSAEALAALRLPSGAAVPTDVRAWLAFSATEPALLRELAPPTWDVTTARAFVEAEVSEVAAELEGIDLGDGESFDEEEAIERMLDSVPDELRDVAWVRLADSASQAWFVALTGELPVLTYEKEEFWVAHPSFIAYLEWRLG